MGLFRQRYTRRGPPTNTRMRILAYIRAGQTALPLQRLYEEKPQAGTVLNDRTGMHPAFAKQIVLEQPNMLGTERDRRSGSFSNSAC